MIAGLSNFMQESDSIRITEGQGYEEADIFVALECGISHSYDASFWADPDGSDKAS